MSELSSSLRSRVAGLNHELDQDLDQDADDFSTPEAPSRQHFDRLLQDHREKLLLYAMALVNNSADAEDLCQRISLVMWQKFSQYDPSRSFLSWACGIARLEAYNFRRSRAADRLIPQNDLPQLLAVTLENFDLDPAEQRLAALRKCIQALPELEQSFLREIYWEGQSCESIAQRLHCTIRTFYNRMYLLRRRLLKCVSRRLNDEP